jgi:hypothetical protein
MLNVTVDDPAGLTVTFGDLPAVLAPLIVTLAIVGIAYKKPAFRVYAAYFIVVLCAAMAASQVGNWMYFVAFCIGGLTAFTEIITKFGDDPLKAFMTPQSVAYHVFNGLIAAGALYVLLLNGAPADTPISRGQLVLSAGLGAMLLMRSKFFNVKVGNDVVAFGPEQLIRVFLGFLEAAIDRTRSKSRIDFVKTAMDNVDVEKVHEYALAMLDAPQLLDPQKRAALEQRITHLCQPDPSQDNQLRSYRLGFAVLDTMGELFVARMFGSNLPPEYRIRAPQTESTLLEKFLTKDNQIVYFTYAADMSRTRLLRRLGWTEGDAAAAWKDERNRPRKATLDEYRIVFGVPEPGRPGESRATVVSSPNSHVEGVVYRIPRDAMRFLDRLSEGYEPIGVRVRLGTNLVDATMYVSRDDPESGLHPTRSYLDMLLVGAEEHQLSHEYIDGLRKVTVLEDVQALPEESAADRLDAAPAVAPQNVVVQSTVANGRSRAHSLAQENVRRNDPAPLPRSEKPAP